MSTTQGHPPRPTTGVTLSRSILGFGAAHGAPIVFSGLLWWMLWWGHVPNVQTVNEAMQHVSWVGVIALVYVALQARAVLAQPRSGVVHSLIEILISLLPLFVVGYAMVDWFRGGNPLSVFQVIVMVQATIASLIDVVIFTWFSLRTEQALDPGHPDARALNGWTETALMRALHTASCAAGTTPGQTH